MSFKYGARCVVMVSDVFGGTKSRDQDGTNNSPQSRDDLD